MTETFKCKCIKRYIDEVFTNRDLLPVGKWYDVLESPSYYTVKYGTNNRFSWVIEKEYFKNYFATIDEVRELEINKILN